MFLRYKTRLYLSRYDEIVSDNCCSPQIAQIHADYPLETTVFISAKICSICGRMTYDTASSSYVNMSSHHLELLRPKALRRVDGHEIGAIWQLAHIKTEAPFVYAFQSSVAIMSTGIVKDWILYRWR